MSTFAVSFDGTRVAFESRGAGSQDVVLIHGWACNRRFWDSQLAPLAARFRVLNIDLPGHGESGRSRRAWTIRALGSDVVAVLRLAEARQCILVGHSMGADVTLEASRQLRSAVEGMIWVDQYAQLSHALSRSSIAARLVPFRADFVNTTRRLVESLFSPLAAPELVARVASEMASASPKTAVATLEATWNHARSVPALLAEVGLPVVAINAANSSTDRDSLAAHGIEVLELRDSGHFPMLERPAELNLMLATAIELVSRRKRRD